MNEDVDAPVTDITFLTSVGSCPPGYRVVSRKRLQCARLAPPTAVGSIIHESSCGHSLGSAPSPSPRPSPILPVPSLLSPHFPPLPSHLPLPTPLPCFRLRHVPVAIQHSSGRTSGVTRRKRGTLLLPRSTRCVCARACVRVRVCMGGWVFHVPHFFPCSFVHCCVLL